MDHERPGLGLGGGRPRQSIMRHEEEEGKEGKEAARSDEDQQQQLQQLRDWLARTNGNSSSSSNESEWVQQWAVAGRAIPGEAPRKAGRKRKQRGRRAGDDILLPAAESESAPAGHLGAEEKQPIVVAPHEAKGEAQSNLQQLHRNGSVLTGSFDSGPTLPSAPRPSKRHMRKNANGQRKQRKNKAGKMDEHDVLKDVIQPRCCKKFCTQQLTDRVKEVMDLRRELHSICHGIDRQQHLREQLQGQHTRVLLPTSREVESGGRDRAVREGKAPLGYVLKRVPPTFLGKPVCALALQRLWGVSKHLINVARRPKIAYAGHVRIPRPLLVLHDYCC